MSFNVKLSHKGIILVSVPLLFEMIFVGILTHIQYQAEAEAAKAAHSKAISDSVGQLVHDVVEVVRDIDGDHLAVKGLDLDQYRRFIKDIIQQIGTIRELCKDNPKQLAIINDADATLQDARRMFDHLVYTYQTGSTYEVLTELRTTRKLIKSSVKHLSESDLLVMAQQEKEIESESPAKQAQYRGQVRQLLLVAVGFNILLTVFLALYFSRGIVRRIALMTDNSYRLADGRPLHPRLPGGDEISNLDRVFHNMADALVEASRKERAILENALDVICSFDEYGTFTAINPASRRVLGYEPEELIGKSYREFVAVGDCDAAESFMKELIKGAELQPFEVRLVRKDGKLIDTVWSVHWSETQRLLYCVIHDMTERKEAERMKQEILAMVTHDLKTPLTTIGSFLELLEAEVFGELSERGKGSLQIAERNVERMTALIRDLLDVEKAKAGMLELNLRDQALSPLLEQAALSVSTWAAEKKVSIKAFPCDLMVSTEAERLMQVLVNLLSNAIKFSPEGGSVYLSGNAVADNMVEISVKDEGRGIPQEALRAIFDRFQQVHKMDSRKHGGTGLGLAICKAIVELNHGTIGVDSELGKGSRFYFTIPAGGAASSSLLELSEAQEIVSR